MSASSNNGPRIAVVGAGLAGLVAGDLLATAGANITVIEKARGPGGRAATRRYDDGWRFDHGMQYFTARSESFRAEVARWCDAGVVAPWSPRLEGDAESSPDPGGSLPDAGRRGAGGGATGAKGGQDQDRDEDHATPPSDPSAPTDAWFVGVPGSNAPCQWLAESGRMLLRAGVRVDRITSTSDGPRLTMDRAVGGPGRVRYAPDQSIVEALEAMAFDAVLVTAPAPQIGPLLGDAPELADLVRASGAVRLAPCWALMLGFVRSVDVPWDVRRRSDGPVSWMVREASKPGRHGPADGPGESWMVHASPDWSAEHVELDRETAADRLRDMAMSAFEEAGGRPGPEAPVVCTAHRWRYALVTEPANEPCIWNAAVRVGIAGDWGLAGRFESAFTSGRALAEAVAGSFDLMSGD